MIWLINSFGCFTSGKQLSASLDIYQIISTQYCIWIQRWVSCFWAVACVYFGASPTAPLANASWQRHEVSLSFQQFILCSLGSLIFGSVFKYTWLPSIYRLVLCSPAQDNTRLFQPINLQTHFFIFLCFFATTIASPSAFSFPIQIPFLYSRISHVLLCPDATVRAADK